MTDTVKRPTVILAGDREAEALLKQELDLAEKQAEGKAPKSIVFSILEDLQKSQFNYGSVKQEPIRLSFDQDPSRTDIYHGLYQDKPYLLPAALIKKIHRTDDLFAAILNVRSNHLSMFGRPRSSRFDIGFEIVVDREYTEKMDEEQKKKVVERVSKAEKRLYMCGSDVGYADSDKQTFPQLLKMLTMDALRFGRMTTEIVHPKDDPEAFHSLRAVDAGTIYKIVPHSEQGAQQLREASKKLLERIKEGDFDSEAFDRQIAEWVNGKYAYVQMTDNRPIQAFRATDIIVHDVYPITDIEYNGYPLTPLDTIISQITTHINITQHNKLYFQSGRAARGMLVIKSDSVDRQVVENVKLQFNASINGVQNSWRMPVFGCGAQEDIAWVPLDSSGSRDGEFQILADANARAILAAYQMSPDEIPGYGHLSRATGSQTMSESNNEFKLEAARDVGLRPLILTVQDMINSRIFPLIDEELSKHATIVLSGLDADDPLRETERLTAEMNVHATYNYIMETVDKNVIPKELGGEFPLNPQFQKVLDTYLTVGQVLEFFFGIPNASKDPAYAYVRDPLWMQWQQMVQQERQMQAQMQMQQQQAQAQDEQTDKGRAHEADMKDKDQKHASEMKDKDHKHATEQADKERDHASKMKDKDIAASAQLEGKGKGPADEDEEEIPEEGAPQPDPQVESEGQPELPPTQDPQVPPPEAEAPAEEEAPEGDLTSSIEQLASLLMNKSEKQLPTSRKRLIAQQRATVHKVLTAWESESESFLKDILKEAEAHSNKKEDK